MYTHNRHFPILVLVAAVLLGSHGSARAADASGHPQKWALVIAVEKYHRAMPLRYTINDVQQVTKTLRLRGDFPSENMLEIVETNPNPRYQPLRSSLMAELRTFLLKPGPEDYVLVYFSGHGFRDKDGKLYLAPIDCDPDDPAPTGVPVEWFRQQLTECKAKTKLLVLDACHAGSDKGEGEKGSVGAKDLGSQFREVKGVVTIASSTGDEKSLIWEEKEQSLFSYWLNQGLKGHADADGDGVVTIDELYDYVYRNVTHTAKARFPRPQTPVRLFRDAPGVPEVVRLRPQSLKQVLSDVAEQLAWAMEERQLAKVGVLEFTNDTKLGELLGADFGLLGRYCAEEIERRLMEQGSGKFSVIDRRRLQTAIKSNGFGINDLGSTDALRQLSQRAGGMPVIALGTLRNRAGRMVSLQSKLVQTEGDEVVGNAGGTAALSESEWAMLGRSVQVGPDDRRPAASVEGRHAPSVEATLISRLDRRSEGAHPLADASCPYRVKIMVKDASGKLTERKGVYRGNDMFVGLRQGEVYQIYIENLSGQIVLMRLLVDGLNTLPERERTKAMIVEAAPPASGNLVVGVRVNLTEARHWVLDPKQSTVMAVRGFFKATTGSGPNYNEFRVVDAQKSLAARQKFTDQLGLITAAFYAPKGGSRAVATDLGDEGTEKLQERAGTECGNLLAVIHIHYVEPEVLGSRQ